MNWKNQQFFDWFLLPGHAPRTCFFFKAEKLLCKSNLNIGKRVLQTDGFLEPFKTNMRCATYVLCVYRISTLKCSLQCTWYHYRHSRQPCAPYAVVSNEVLKQTLTTSYIYSKHIWCSYCKKLQDFQALVSLGKLALPYLPCLRPPQTKLGTWRNTERCTCIKEIIKVK